MTPEYASPEQVHGDPITTATDVYALGMVLCQILTGSLPYDVSGKSPIEIGSVISDTALVKPSSILGNEKGKNQTANILHLKGLNKKQLKKQLRGDLDNIVLKALRKEPERRYGSADQLLQDIRHYQKMSRFLQDLKAPVTSEILTGWKNSFVNLLHWNNNFVNRTMKESLFP